MSIEAIAAAVVGVTVLLTFIGGLTVRFLVMFIDAQIGKRTDPMIETLAVMATKIDNGILQRLMRVEANRDTMDTRIVGVPPPEPLDGDD